MAARAGVPKSRVCRERDHDRCGGGLVSSSKVCQCGCHKRRGRPAMQGAAREAARRRVDRSAAR